MGFGFGSAVVEFEVDSHPAIAEIRNPSAKQLMTAMTIFLYIKSLSLALWRFDLVTMPCMVRIVKSEVNENALKSVDF